MEGPCGGLNEVIIMFNEFFGLSNPTCFASVATLQWNLALLIWAAIFLLLLGQMVLGLSRLALQDRSFHPGEHDGDSKDKDMGWRKNLKVQISYKNHHNRIQIASKIQNHVFRYQKF